MTTRDTALGADGLARLQGRLHALVGQPWSIAYLSYGREVRVGLGALARGRRGFMNGEWTLGTRGSPWLLEVAGKPVATEADDERTWVASLEALKGRVVKHADVTMPGPDLSVELEGGHRFAILASKQSEWVAWELFCPDGSTITANCDGSWVVGRRGEVDEE